MKGRLLLCLIGIAVALVAVAVILFRCVILPAMETRKFPVVGAESPPVESDDDAFARGVKEAQKAREAMESNEADEMHD